MRRKIPKAVFEPLEEALCEDLLTIPYLVEMVKKETPLAIREALDTKKNFATLFEINGLGVYLDIPKQYWIPALEQCIDTMSKEEKFEECVSMKKLIDEISTPSKPARKKSAKPKTNGTTSE